MNSSKKMTRTDVQSLAAWTGKKVIKLGYCEGQYLLRNAQRIGYGAGVYGWNYDVYSVDGAIICTGYRGMPGRRPECDCDEYEKRAEQAARSWDADRLEQVDAILADFVAAA